MTIPAAKWFRVSTGHQTDENQVPDVDQFCEHHGYTEAAAYNVSESAWNGGKNAGEYRRAINQVLADAQAGKFKVLVVWAIDRITRDGARGVLNLVHDLRKRGCILVSVKEPWLNGAPEVQDLLLSFAGWMAQQESTRRSDRIKNGLERRKREGKPVGRQPGAADKKRRKRSGYVASWEGDGAHRRAAAEVAERRRGEALAKACPKCAAKPGETCEAPRHAPGRLHAARYEAAGLPTPAGGGRPASKL